MKWFSMWMALLLLLSTIAGYSPAYALEGTAELDPAVLQSPVFQEDGSVRVTGTSDSSQLFIAGNFNGWQEFKEMAPVGSYADGDTTKHVFSYVISTAEISGSNGLVLYKYAPQPAWHNDEGQDNSFTDALNKNPLQDGNSAVQVLKIESSGAPWAAGQTVQLKALHGQAEGSPKDVSAEVEWTTDHAMVKIDSQGKAVIDAAAPSGPVQVTAAYQGITVHQQFEIAGTPDPAEQFTYRIHYYRHDGKARDWNLWIWLDGKDGQGYFFDEGQDDHGFAVANVTLPASKINLITRLSTAGNDWQSQEMTRSFRMPQGQQQADLWLLQDDPAVYSQLPDTSPKFRAVQADAVDMLNAEASAEVTEEDAATAVLKDAVTGEELSVSAVKTGDHKLNVQLLQPEQFDVTHEYMLSTRHLGETKVTMRKILDDPKYYYNGDDLGLTYSAQESVFKVWAPTAKKVSTVIYDTAGAYNENGTVQDHSGGSENKMTRGEHGVWEATVPGDLSGKFYMYKAEFADGAVNYAVDPYARAVSANGQRTAIVDLARTNPAAWNPEEKPAMVSPNDAIIYELHVRDFSVSPDSGMTNKGKFKAFTERGTRTAQGASTGIDHLKELGVTHVHLLPSYDFKTVNELTVDDPASPNPKFNWGYDPQNYNVPEGSYSTDPANPSTRIAEFKEMVQALHDEGIRVVMDVVYNHTFSIEEGPFNKLVPGYYYRTNEAGQFTNATGVGNEVASERPMVSKYIQDSVMYWAKEYGIDGFRFDLMGLVDVNTMSSLTSKLHEQVDPSIIVYGEPWDMSGTPLPQDQKSIKGSQRGKSFGVFNDDLRGAIKGDSDGAGKGFATGASGQEGAVLQGVRGAVDTFADTPSESVSYVTAHDNLNLWDKVIATMGLNDQLGMLHMKDGVLADGGSVEEAAAKAAPYLGVGSGNEVLSHEAVKRSLLANGIVLTSQGIPFLHAGDELLRTKYGDHNSYKSPDVINQIRWDNKDQFGQVFDYYRGLIELRKSHPAFRLNTKQAVEQHFQVLKSDGNVVAFQLKNYAGGDSWKNIVVIYNANLDTRTVSLPGDGTWNIVVNDRAAGTKVLDTVSGGSFAAPGLAVTVLYDEAAAEYTPVATEITLPAAELGLAPGSSKLLSAVVKDQHGKVMPGAKVSYESSNPGVAKVSPNGLIQALKEGTAVITAVSGNAKKTVTVHVGKLEPAKITITGADTVYPGQSMKLTATVRDQYGQLMTGPSVTWASSAPSIAKVGSAGDVTAIKPGRVTITAAAGKVKAEKQLTVQAFVQKTVQLHYIRPDQDYTDWNLWIWGTGGVSDGQVDFTVKDGVAVANIKTAPDSSSVGFVLRKGTDWNTAKQDIQDDRYISIPAGQTFVKARVTSMVKEIASVPALNGPVLEDGSINFYFRDDALFRDNRMQELEGVKLRLAAEGQQPEEFEMTYDAAGEYFAYTVNQAREGTYRYSFLVTKKGQTEEVLDLWNPLQEGGKSLLVYEKPQLNVAASILPNALNLRISARQNAVLKLDVGGEGAVKLREAYADLTPLGGEAKAVIDLELMQRTISVKDTVAPGPKQLRVTVVDKYGNKHTAAAEVTVVPQQPACPDDFDWDEARIYFLLTDRFFNGDTSNDNSKSIPGSLDLNQPEAYHGGDIRGIIQRLDYLDQLGINTIWITPIVDNIDYDVRHGKTGVQYGYHGYWAQDFTRMDEHLGDTEDMKDLIEQAHKRGMKIMVDVVLNHAGYGMKLTDPQLGLPGYPSMEDRERFADMLRSGGSDTVQGELAGLPDFMTEDPAVRERLIQWQVDWLDKVRTDAGETIDYFRVDTVKHVDHTTWMAFKNALTEIKPDFKLIGEYFGASADNHGDYWGQGQMDSLLDFQFKEKAKEFVNGNLEAVEKYLEQRNALLSNDKTLGQFLSSHDEDGFLSELVGGDTGKLKVAAALQITSKGQPVVYYGEELGQSGKNAGDMDQGQFSGNRDDMPWDKLDAKDPAALAIHDHYAKLLNIRERHSKVFAKGSRSQIGGSDEEKYLVFERTYNKDTVLVGLNVDSTGQKITFGTPFAGGTKLVDEYNGQKYTVDANGKITLTLPGRDQGGTVILAKDGSAVPEPNTPPGSAPSGNTSSPAATDGSQPPVLAKDVLRIAEPKAVGGVIAVMLEQGLQELQLPISAAALDGRTHLRVTGEAFRAELPAAVLEQAKALLPEAKRTGAWLAVRVERAEMAQPQGQADGSLRVIPAGAAVRFSLALVLADGSRQELERFTSPVALSLQADAASALDRSLLSIYSLGADGARAYAGGAWVDGQLTVKVGQPGIYGVLAYDKTFKDVPAGHWAAQAIKAMSARHVVKGVATDAFAPEREVTRAEFAALLVRALGLPDAAASAAKGAGAFKDVPASSWYAEATGAASQAGLVKGRPDGTFGAQERITREEMAVMLVRAYAELAGGNAAALSQQPAAPRFGDAASLSPWARDAAVQASGLGLIKGRPGGQFAPKAYLTRAESAQLLANLLLAR
ncbi:type I pullulanase [Paenibacillus sp. CAA11]|uniref:type I pullulanase n=1 Tax=Paenibacillus sp. CAA11 TaxID=1532905 RepID=UPI00131F3C2E|nr:type I pullulanase [Paenibacillus sp. CAA11]